MEYIQLDPSEQLFGKRSLLQSQMDLLNIIKRYQRYSLLRKEELALKVLLRKKINELWEEIKHLEKVLPHVKHIKEQKTIEKKVLPKKRSELELEIEEISRKLETLQ